MKNTAPNLRLEEMPEAFQEAFLGAEDSVELKVFLPQDVLEVEEWPYRMEHLRQSVTFAVVQEDSAWVLFQNNSWGHLQSRGRWCYRRRAVNRMMALAGNIPGQFDFPTEEELACEIQGNPSAWALYFGNLDLQLLAIREPYNPEVYPNTCYWLVQKSLVNGKFLLWRMSDEDNTPELQGRYETEQEALDEMASQKEGVEESDSCLLSQAQEELESAQLLLLEEQLEPGEPSELRDRVQELEAAIDFLESENR